MNLEELIHSIDIVEFLSQYIDLEEQGGEYWGLSCFKQEKTPSFSVRRDPPFFYDYSSGQGGNVFNFVKAYHHCSSSEAIEILKKYAGFSGEVGEGRKKLAAASVCKRFIPPKHTQKASKAIILPDNYMERYEKRDDKLDVWRREGISDASLTRFQVFYDRFDNRLVYPIRNMDGKIINVGGRTLDPDFKAKGLRKYNYYYSWGTISTVYGVFENLKYIKEAGEVILFEGCKSVLIADTWGIRNTGAILTSHLSPTQMKILLRLGVRVVFALDKDVDVTTDKNIGKLKNYTNVSYLKDTQGLLEAKDAPVDKGLEVFQKLYDAKLHFS